MLALLAHLPAQAQTRWEIATEYPANAMPGEGVALFAKLVTETSGALERSWWEADIAAPANCNRKLCP